MAGDLKRINAPPFHLRHVAKETACYSPPPCFMTIDLHAADPCSKCRCAVPRITISDLGARITCTKCGHQGSPCADAKKAVVQWNQEWRSLNARLSRFWAATVCLILEHRLGKTLRIDPKGVWCHCDRCKRNVVLPHPTNFKINRKRHHAATK